MLTLYYCRYEFILAYQFALLTPNYTDIRFILFRIKINITLYKNWILKHSLYFTCIYFKIIKLYFAQDLFNL
jgi:hypothetical protein